MEPGNDRLYEWVELVNTGSVAVNTDGWMLSDASAADPLPAVEVPPGGFLVVAGANAVLPAGTPVIRVPDGSIGNGLNNRGDALRLLTPTGEVVDALSYGENRSVFSSPPAAAHAGATLAARSLDGQADAERWVQASRPTPGSLNVFAVATPVPAVPNATPAPAASPTPTSTPVATSSPTPAATEASPTPGEGVTERVDDKPAVDAEDYAPQADTLTLRLSEVLADPVESGIDRDWEWVALVNTGGAAVSTEGWSLGDAAASDALPAVVVPSGGFVVVAAERAVLPEGTLVVRVPDGSIGNGLNNGGDAVRLLAPTGEVVDALSYGANRDVFASPPAAADSGATLAARSIDGQADAERWLQALRPTPGDVNVFAQEEAEAVGEPEATSAATSASSTVERDASGNTSDSSREPSRAGETIPIRFERGSGSSTPWIVLGAVAGRQFGAGGWVAGPSLAGRAR